ncbi:hypothetical protein GGF42_004738 [Coemansia sp. RSA 2424]|nr:hypothetical protein GGF42_004738 [Coemansia sp. RSA 2424]
MGKPSTSATATTTSGGAGQKQEQNGVLKHKDLAKARRRVAKIEKKLQKLAAMTEEERDTMCERQVQRKMDKAAKRASKDGSENPYADVVDERTSSKAKKKRLAQLKAGVLEKVTAKRSKREEKLARLKEVIATADSAMLADSKPSSESSSAQKASGGWNNWAAADFESEERKAKFLRFMGVKSSTTSSSSGTTSASPYASAITKDGSNKIQRDLEKQFQAGVQMRLQTQRGGRGGLGM